MKITRQPLFWIVQVLLFLVCTGISLHLYPKAFPSVDLKIKMNRKEALKAASDLANQNNWGPDSFQQAVTFDLDSETQTFVELSAGGSEAFKQILDGKLYSPYNWKVRHFFPGKSTETYIKLSPSGDFYGFMEKLPEDAPGKALDVQVAQKIAEQAASHTWKVDLSAYQLVEKSKEVRPSRRVDHIFVYERVREKIGDGAYRLKLVVGGDHLTELTHFIKIPEAFFRRYSEMRSFNNTIATIATVSMVLFYLICGCGLGIFLLARKHWVIWRTPLLCGFIVALVQVLEQFNQFPLVWMRYDTAISPKTFLARNLLSALMMFFLEWVLLSLSFMAAESLTRRAFPHHPQLWKMWKKENAASIEVLGRTLGGYLVVGLFFSYVVLIYLFGRNYLGWWNPTDILFHPDGLATYFPWYTSISNSLHAGFWEESLFRAVPLAGAALIGAKFGHRKKWLTLGFVVQALIFAAAHANYPTQPSYARVIELIFPSFMFGGIYLYFGLLPGIILHFTFDVISFSIPLFTASTPGIWNDRILVIFFLLVPLWVVLFNRTRLGHWSQLKPSDYNQAWVPEEPKPQPMTTVHHEKPVTLGRIFSFILPTAAIVISLIWILVIPREKTVPTLVISKQEAMQRARTALTDLGVQLPAPWETLAHLASTEPDEQDAFIWRTVGPKDYFQFIGNYLSPPSWEIRFVRFDTNVEERAEEYRVFITGKGEILLIQHDLPESRSAKSVDQVKARSIALRHIQNNYKLDHKSLREVSSRAFKLPARTDWLFVFADSKIRLALGEARIAIRISGDQVTSSSRFIFVPEEWARNERNRENLQSIIKTICSLIFFLLFLAGIIVAIISWTRHHFRTKSFFITFGLFFAASVVQLANSLPSKLAHFSTEEPKINQIISVISFGLLKALALSVTGGLFVGYLHYRSKPTRIPLSLSLPIGYATGALITLGIGAIFHSLPQLSPTWGSLSGFDFSFPILTGLSTLTNYVLLTLFFAWIIQITNWLTSNWSRRKWLGILFLLINGWASFGIICDTIPSALILGTLYGLILILLYRFLIRSTMSLIPLINASAVLIAELKQISLQPYAGVTRDSVVAMIAVIALSVIWHKRLNEDTSKV